MLKDSSLEPKKKRARGRGWTSSQNTPRQEPINESLEEMAGKEVVSRSGRKIKPKRFADFSSSDEFDTGKLINSCLIYLFIIFFKY